MPSRRAVLMMRQAISPRLAIRIRLNMAYADNRGRATEDGQGKDRAFMSGCPSSVVWYAACQGERGRDGRKCTAQRRRPTFTARRPSFKALSVKLSGVPVVDVGADPGEDFAVDIGRAQAVGGGRWRPRPHPARRSARRRLNEAILRQIDSVKLLVHDGSPPSR